jgi:hypothetical protein
MAEQHEREVALFEAALQLPPEQRQAYLEQACAADAGLLSRIQVLLEVNANESRTDFMAGAAPEAQSSLKASFERADRVGDRIGPYKLLQEIGEGGCGVVYMAKQEEPIRRRVALKIIKLGMDTRQVVARFEAERRALALMDHPNIAKVHDAGATATGRPYFVMELVRGLKITHYCDEKKLTTQQRLVQSGFNTSVTVDCSRPLSSASCHVNPYLPPNLPRNYCKPAVTRWNSSDSTTSGATEPRKTTNCTAGSAQSSRPKWTGPVRSFPRLMVSRPERNH